MIKSRLFLTITVCFICVAMLVGCESEKHPSGKEYYTISDFDDIIIGESTIDDIYSITSNVPFYASSYGFLIELPKEGGGYIHIKCYGPEGIVGSIEEVSKSVDPRK